MQPSTDLTQQKSNHILINSNDVEESKELTATNQNMYQTEPKHMQKKQSNAMKTSLKKGQAKSPLIRTPKKDSQDAQQQQQGDEFIITNQLREKVSLSNCKPTEKRASFQQQSQQAPSSVKSKLTQHNNANTKSPLKYSSNNPWNSQARRKLNYNLQGVQQSQDQEAGENPDPDQQPQQEAEGRNSKKQSKNMFHPNSSSNNNNNGSSGNSRQPKTKKVAQQAQPAKGSATRPKEQQPAEEVEDELSKRDVKSATLKQQKTKFKPKGIQVQGKQEKAAASKAPKQVEASSKDALLKTGDLRTTNDNEYFELSQKFSTISDPRMFQLEINKKERDNLKNSGVQKKKEEIEENIEMESKVSISNSPNINANQLSGSQNAQNSDKDNMGGFIGNAESVDLSQKNNPTSAKPLGGRQEQPVSPFSVSSGLPFFFVCLLWACLLCVCLLCVCLCAFACARLLCARLLCASRLCPLCRSPHLCKLACRLAGEGAEQGGAAAEAERGT